jgi:methylthioribose-1-phosphate isomerase
MKIAAVKWVSDVNGFLDVIDQRKLPQRLVKIKIKDVKTLVESIKTLSVRGAPALGVAAAYGLVLALQKTAKTSNVQDALVLLKKQARKIVLSRPTAVNLFWAVNRLMQKAQVFISKNPQAPTKDLKKLVLDEADKIYREDVNMCRMIGRFGERFIKDGAGILTHCNAGFLATAGEGTALSAIYQAHKKGKKFRVYVDETRPLLQGSRLTAWELKQAGIDTTVICDSMAGNLMKQRKISMVLTGADRIAANGDSANKIGTYSLSVLAMVHKIPFHIAAPSSTFDLSVKNGSSIPIEYRPADEVAKIMGKRIAPKGVRIENPAFDITPAKNITAIITDRGIIRKPSTQKIAAFFRRHNS